MYYTQGQDASLHGRVAIRRSLSIEEGSAKSMQARGVISTQLIGQKGGGKKGSNDQKRG